MLYSSFFFSQGVAFKTDVAKNKIILYVVTTEEVMSYDLNGDKLVLNVVCVLVFEMYQL